MDCKVGSYCTLQGESVNLCHSLINVLKYLEKWMYLFVNVMVILEFYGKIENSFQK